MTVDSDSGQLLVGWAQVDLSPEGQVLITGQFHARVSEGVADPITATALVLDTGEDHIVMVGCDVVAIADELRDAVRAGLRGLDGLDPMKVVLNATHTHTGPQVRPEDSVGTTAYKAGVDLDVMVPSEYIEMAAARVANAVGEAWRDRSPGQVACGLGHAVVGRNRRWHDTGGAATMYGNTDTERFSHIEGYEDHAVGVMATYTPQGDLTGVAVNVPCPSQVSENQFVLSADYWCETRNELRRRLGESLFILPQCSVAGDQSPHMLYDKTAEERMWRLAGRTERQEIANRIADAVGEVLPAIESEKDGTPVIVHRAEDIDLPLNNVSEDLVRIANEEAEKLRVVYEEELRKLEADPKLRDEKRWYVNVTRAYRRMYWFLGVAMRAEQPESTLSTEIHVCRVGNAVFATNRFEYYLDYGIFMKARSPAEQTFLIQLAGPGTYVPSARSLTGGGYGSMLASNPVGPEGGRMLAERTVDIINELWTTA